MEVYKILVVGEPLVGKSTLITAFFNCDELAEKKAK
jgi:GTPase SAR1 family protein